MGKYLGGHISIGRLTIFGANAMHWGVNIQTKRWGYICFRLPITVGLRWYPLYFYLSPNGTPWASTLYFGPSLEEREKAKLRKMVFGHNFDSDKNYEELREINYELTVESYFNKQKRNVIIEKHKDKSYYLKPL